MKKGILSTLPIKISNIYFRDNDNIVTQKKPVYFSGKAAIELFSN